MVKFDPETLYVCVEHDDYDDGLNDHSGVRYGEEISDEAEMFGGVAPNFIIYKLVPVARFSRSTKIEEMF
jgi:hypothetical protein